VKAGIHPPHYMAQHPRKPRISVLKYWCIKCTSANGQCPVYNAVNICHKPFRESVLHSQCITILLHIEIRIPSSDVTKKRVQSRTGQIEKHVMKFSLLKESSGNMSYVTEAYHFHSVT
jgi:hypothetical protein